MEHQKGYFRGDFRVASLLSSGTASLLRIASAARSGSPGERAVGAGEAGLVFRQTLIHFVELFFELVISAWRQKNARCLPIRHWQPRGCVTPHRAR